MARKLKLWRESASVILSAKTQFPTANLFNYKILSLKRSAKSGYMPSNFVFPGGNISKNDSHPDWLRLFEKFGFPQDSFNDLVPKKNVPQILKSNKNSSVSKHLSFRLCAIRETFEESGILLCRSPGRNAQSTWTSFIGKYSVVKIL